MSINSNIIFALSELGIPIKPNAYTGTAKEYITFNYSSIGADHADDAPEHDVYYVQVHYFCPLTKDCVALCKSIKKMLFGGGFSWPEMINAGDVGSGNQNTAGKYQHYVFECEYAEGVDLDGET